MFKKFDLTNMVFGIGAAIVILGALFKLEHWPGGSTLLKIGMITEALLFTYSAFEKSEKTIPLEPQYIDLGDTFLVKQAQERYVNKINQATNNISSMNEVYSSVLKAIKN